MVTIVVDGKTLSIDKGAVLLKACLDNGIYIPNLCYLGDYPDPSAAPKDWPNYYGYGSGGIL